MGCGQSRLSRRIQALPRPNFEEFIRICRSGSLRDPNLSKRTLLREDGVEPQDQEDDLNSTSFEAKPSPERPNVKVTVAPHLEKEMHRDDIDGFEGQEGIREQNVGSIIAPLKRVFFKDEAVIVKETPKTKEMEEEEEEKEDKNKGNIEDDRWIGKSGSPSFRIYLPESIPSDEDDDDDNVKDVDADKTSPDEDRSTENPSSNEVSDASETKSGGKGRRFMEAVRRRRLNISCCNASHQQPAPEQQ